MLNKIWLSWIEIDRNGKPCNSWGSYFPDSNTALKAAELLKTYRYVGEISIDDETEEKNLFTWKRVKTA